MATTRRHHSGRSLPPTSSRLSALDAVDWHCALNGLGSTKQVRGRVPLRRQVHVPRESMIGSTRLTERPGRRSGQ